HVEAWGARASTNSVGYRLVREFRLGVIERVMEPIVARCQTLHSSPRFIMDRHELPVWLILSREPAHLLNPRYGSYQQLLADAIDSILAGLDREGIPLEAATWGRRNTVRLQHP